MGRTLLRSPQYQAPPRARPRRRKGEKGIEAPLDFVREQGRIDSYQPKYAPIPKGKRNSACLARRWARSRPPALEQQPLLVRTKRLPRENEELTRLPPTIGGFASRYASTSADRSLRPISSPRYGQSATLGRCAPFRNIPKMTGSHSILGPLKPSHGTFCRRTG